jgi:multicomponent Na+:H+ antiporter subunit C
MIQYTALLLVLIGLYGLLTDRNIIKILVAVNVMELGINLFIISIGYVEGGIAPILTAVNSNNGLSFVDPLPQALVLTAIVIGVGITGVGLSFARKIHQQYGTYDLTEWEVKKHD